MLIVDAHLDLAYNVTRGRDVTRPAVEQPICQSAFPEIATVGLPDLRAGGVGLVCGTIFCEPATDGRPGYTTPDEAQVMAWEQMQWYLRQFKAGNIDLVTSAQEVPSAPTDGAIPLIVLLEGADPIRSVEDVRMWFDVGLRIVGLAWKRTRFAGGTGAPGPLTSEGISLVRELDRLGIIHDASHLAEESFWQLLDVSGGPVIASHSNCRAIVPGDRHLSDEMIRAIVRRGGMIGINFFDKFLLPPEEKTNRRATLADVVRHVRHICDLAGGTASVGLGTDMDGGLGREQIPVEIATSADLPRVADALSSSGFIDDAVRDILGGNWCRYFRAHLPRDPAVG